MRLPSRTTEGWHQWQDDDDAKRAASRMGALDAAEQGVPDPVQNEGGRPAILDRVCRRRDKELVFQVDKVLGGLDRCGTARSNPDPVSLPLTR